MSEFYYDLTKGKKIQDIAEKHIKQYFDNSIFKTHGKSSQPVDFVSISGTRYEIKSGYNEYKQTIIIEEYSKGLNEYNKDGWWYKLVNGTIVLFFPSLKLIDKIDNFIYLTINDDVKNIYEKNLHKFNLIKNKPTYTINENNWVSAYRNFKLDLFNNYFTKYKIIKDFL